MSRCCSPVAAKATTEAESTSSVSSANAARFTAHSTDIAKAEGECGIITTMINKYNAENPDMKVSQNVVAWPGYPQLTAQVAARDPPDVVTMHSGVISDYADAACSSRSSRSCAKPGSTRQASPPRACAR